MDSKLPDWIKKDRVFLFILITLVTITLIVTFYVTYTANKSQDLVFNLSAALNSSLCGCKNSIENEKSVSRIANGTRVTSGHDFSWVASLYVIKEEVKLGVKIPFFLSFCTGSLLNERSILTAKHCLEIESVSKRLYVALGGTSHDLAETALLKTNHREVKSYKTVPEADLAVFFVIEPFDLDEKFNILPGCLFFKKSSSFKNDKLIGLGYGMQSSPRMLHNMSDEKVKFVNQFAKKLYATTFKQIDHPSCRIYSKRICVRNEFSGTCPGDSGAPLILERDNKLYIIGVLRGGLTVEEECSSNTLSIYTDIYPYLNWIKSVINDEMCI